MTRRLGWIAFGLVSAALLVAHVLIIAPGFTTTRLWEDEAFNLTVPVNLLAGLGYTSDGTLTGSVLTPFDERISTGPLLLLPVAAVLGLGADPVIGGRIVATLFWMLLIAGLFVLGRAVAGVWGGLLAASVPLGLNIAQLPSPVQGPTDILGEIPAAALVVWAVVSARRWPWLGGLLLGLATQAKFIAWLAVPALVVFVLLVPGGMPWGRRLLRVLPAAALAVVPTVLYEIAKFATLGLDEYIDATREYYWFVRLGGQNIISVAPTMKLQLLLDHWHVPILVAISVALVAIGGVVVAWLRIREDDDAAVAAFGDPDVVAPATGTAGAVRASGYRTAEPREWTRHQIAALGVAALVGVASYAGWWMVSQHTPAWIRHPSVGLLAFAPMVAAVALRGWSALAAERSLVMRIGGTAGVTVLALGAVAGLVGHLADGPLNGQTLAQQRQVADEVGAAIGTDPREGVGGGLPSAERGEDDWLAVEWGSAVSIAFLTGSHLGLLDAGAPMADDPWMWTGGADEACDELLVVEGYTVCAPPNE